MSNQVAKNDTIAPDDNALESIFIGDYISEAKIDSLLDQLREELRKKKADIDKEVTINNEFKKIVVDQIASAISKKILVSHFDFDIEALEPINPDSDLLPRLLEKSRFLQNSVHITEAYDLYQDWVGRHQQISAQLGDTFSNSTDWFSKCMKGLLPRDKKFQKTEGYVYHYAIDSFIIAIAEAFKRKVKKGQKEFEFPINQLITAVQKTNLYNRAYQADKEAILKQLDTAIALKAKNIVIPQNILT